MNSANRLGHTCAFYHVPCDSNIVELLFLYCVQEVSEVKEENISTSPGPHPSLPLSESCCVDN